MAALQYLRDSFMAKVSGIDDDAASRALVPSGTSLRWLVEHVTLAEQAWVITRSGAAPVVSATGDDTLASALDRYRATSAQVDAIISSTPLDTVWRGYTDDDPVNLRWVIVHLVEEIARHAGHADILRELIDGATGR